ncbi:MAG: TrbI/VirB10 family protein [Dongiaceae bacterium]
MRLNQQNFLKWVRISAVLSLCALAACGEEKKAEVPPPAPPPPPIAAPIPEPAPLLPPIQRPGRLSYGPSNLQLGPTLPGNSDSRSFVLTNTGEITLALNDVRLEGDQGELSLGGSCINLMPRNLAPNESCDLTVMFTPIQSGPDVNAEVQINHDGENSPLFLPVVAIRAIAPPPPAPMVRGPSLQLENAIAVAQARMGGRMAVVSEPPPPGPESIISQDLDYTPIGFPPTVSSLPVDRSRLVTADRYIGAVLENTINSQLAGGRIVGVVERHVYGGDGRFVLIPAGSRAVGVYEPLQRQGDTRLRATFLRVMRPDGVAYSTEEGDPSADVMGRLGLIGDVDNRYFDRYAGPLLISLINAIGTYATAPETITRTDSTGNTSTSQTLTPEQQSFQNFSNDLSFIAQRLVEENLNLAPIITIPGGTRFFIMPTKDIMLRGYQFVAANPAIPPGALTETAQIAGQPVGQAPDTAYAVVPANQAGAPGLQTGAPAAGQPNPPLATGAGPQYGTAGGQPGYVR